MRDFEYTPECILFDLLDIDLVHGWLPDPGISSQVKLNLHTADKDTYDLISGLSYNQLMEKLIAKSLLSPVTDKITGQIPMATTEVTTQPINTDTTIALETSPNSDAGQTSITSPKEKSRVEDIGIIMRIFS